MSTGHAWHVVIQASDSAAGIPGGGHVVAAAVLALLLASVHLFAVRLAFLDAIPRSRFLSLSGGVAVAYVFVHLLPEIDRSQRLMRRHAATYVFSQGQVYVVTLLGFVTFYGLERYVGRLQYDTERPEEAQSPEEVSTSGRESSDAVSTGVFWLHIGSFAAYNALIGYLLFHREEAGVVNLAFFGVAMILHFFVNDYGLCEHHRDTYRRSGRWVLAGGVLIGAAVGLLTEINRGLLVFPFAFLAGGIVLNVIKEELPAERESRFWPFALGAGGYTALLLLA